MPNTPLTTIEIQKRLDALERVGMATGGGVEYNPFSANFDYTKLPGYVAPAGISNNTVNNTANNTANNTVNNTAANTCLLYTSPSPRDS